ncbi:hypothetical protein NCS55_00174600 [Fusarium keratoplasticum]|nr:hypothetical protein NCS55_00174600 [Fusarium keratoplasticum]
MAEVIVGFVSAGVGIAAFALQISKGIDALRQMRLKPGEARKDLTTLLEILEILHQAVSLLKGWEGYQPVDGIIQHVQKRYDKIEPALQDLLERYQENGEGHGRQWKRVLARYPKQQIRDLREDINEIINILNLAFMAAQCQPPSTQELTPTNNRHTDPSETQEGDLHRLEDEGDASEMKTCTTMVTNPPTSKPDQEHRVVLSMAKTSSNACGARRYDCSCHLTSVSGRFWFLQYTPLSMFVGSPGVRASGCGCTGLRLRLALSKYGVPVAIVAGIGLMVDGSGFSLQPSLRVERIVKYTSPGFETIWRLEKGLISFPEARTRFIEQYRSDSSLRHHKDPSGNSYIQDPWIYRLDDQISLLRILVADCQMTLADETESFLVQCANWSTKGCHRTLIDIILNSGFDASAIHASPSENWPIPSFETWGVSKMVPDPFFIDFIGTILRHSPSYSGSTNLHNVLLNGPIEAAAHWLYQLQPLENNVNFLGQTPLHIVTTRPDLCRLVLDAGHGVDVTDKLGATPLMYAAAMGQIEVAKLLILRGAGPGLRDARRDWTFLDYAFVCKHWNLALNALLTIQTMVKPSIFQHVVQYALVRAFRHRNALTEDTTFLPKLIQLSDNVNFTFEDDGVKDNNLMHYAGTLETASTLVQCGFNGFNQKNSKGKVAINSLASFCKAPLIQFCLERGTDVGNVDNNGRTILFHFVSRLAWFGEINWDIIDSIKLCLGAGADPFITDDCICPCSPDGCHISSIFSNDFSFISRFHYPTAGSFWAFEILTLLEEYCGIQAAEKFLLSLYRRVQCDTRHISIAHVCCHRGRGIGRGVWRPKRPPRLHDKDIEEILDEESDFIVALDMDMGEVTSFPFSKLCAEFMILFKREYDLHQEEVMRWEEETSAEFSKLYPRGYEVDYRADEYKDAYPWGWPRAYSIAQPMAEYAFWLQHERSRADKPLVRDFHKAGWFERRISRFLEFMDVMEVTFEMLEEEMWEISATPIFAKKMDTRETVKTFLEVIKEARNKE